MAAISGSNAGPATLLKGGSESGSTSEGDNPPSDVTVDNVSGGGSTEREDTVERGPLVSIGTSADKKSRNKKKKNLYSKKNSKTKNSLIKIKALNKTTQNLKTFSISKDAVLFLKSVLVTRVMPSFYILLFLISLPLNALALVTFTCKIKEKKPAVIYMSNLACVDLLFTLLLPLKIHYHLNGSDWVFGEVACRVLSAAFYCYMYCSILLMMCMSVDRLLAVVFPIVSLTWRTTRNSVYVCALAWMLALIGTVPLLLITQTLNIKDLGITCHDALRHNDPADQTYMILFSVLSCLYFFLPLVITLVCYSSIIYALSVKSGRLATSSSSSSSNQRRRAVIMTIATMLEFVVCFAATNAILLYHCVVLVTGGTRGEGNASYMAYMLAVCAGSSSVFLDPLLYYYGSSQCRQQIRSVLRRKKTKRDTKLSNTTEVGIQTESC
ncbi:proteinase-activated receptor 1-like [Misgurnus anguillicaudatus]|uniref:proteinase-activated receptor 1-like n=1 Tax=Misgurnus anguillicaudatus TaxID=75329 RepID=UPI003CCF24BC